MKAFLLEGKLCGGRGCGSCRVPHRTLLISNNAVFSPRSSPVLCAVVESSCADVRTTILLILGCAIQCDRKEFFIQQILNRLNSEQQHAIKDCITEVRVH